MNCVLYGYQVKESLILICEMYRNILNLFVKNNRFNNSSIPYFVKLYAFCIFLCLKMLSIMRMNLVYLSFYMLLILFDVYMYNAVF